MALSLAAKVPVVCCRTAGGVLRELESRGVRMITTIKNQTAGESSGRNLFGVL